MSFWAIIPARLKSTRLPNKPLADIGGQAMVVRVAERAALSGADRIVVATDHADILQVVEKAGFEARLTPESCASGTDRLANIVDQFNLPDDAILVNVQGDEPLIEPGLIRSVAEHLAARPQLAMATAAHTLHDIEQVFNPNVVKVVVNAAQEALYFSRAPIPWARDTWASKHETIPEDMPLYRHIGIYAYRAGFLRRYTEWPAAPLEYFEALEQLRALWQGEKIGVVLTETAPAAGVDTQEDLERVRLLFAQL